MPFFICTACGMQYAESEKPPTQRVICEEERQYVPLRGQSWTTLEALSQSHMNSMREYEPGLTGIGAGRALPRGGDSHRGPDDLRATCDWHIATRHCARSCPKPVGRLFVAVFLGFAAELL